MHLKQLSIKDTGIEQELVPRPVFLRYLQLADELLGSRVSTKVSDTPKSMLPHQRIVVVDLQGTPPLLLSTSQATDETACMHPQCNPSQHEDAEPQQGGVRNLALFQE